MHSQNEPSIRRLIVGKNIPLRTRGRATLGGKRSSVISSTEGINGQLLVAAFDEWMANARANAEFTYFVGHLAGGTRGQEMIRDRAWQAYLAKQVVLVQRRRGECFEYIARRTWL
jgi:hypothetical protein